jgi:SH3/ankyrin repeat-containing protein
MDFLDLPPPEDFMLVSGVETGETSTDLSHNSSSHYVSAGGDRSPSPPPPPPPDSSPPREAFDNSPLVGVKFPPLKKQAALSTPAHDEAQFKVPSPIPSPMNAGSFEADAEPEAILPPQEFIHSNNAGFQIPTPPGFEIPTPPSKDVTGTGHRDAPEPDLDEAIRQLQLLSEDLTPAPIAGSKDTSPQVRKGTSSKDSPPQGRHQQDQGVKKPEILTPVTPEPVSIAPPTWSRSSTSSSNVSSLARDPEIEQSSLSDTTKTQVQMPSMKPVMEWEVEEVCQWLEEIGLGEHCPQFRENEILGEHLLELTKEELAELGVKKIGHKKTFLTKVKELV